MGSVVMSKTQPQRAAKVQKVVSDIVAVLTSPRTLVLGDLSPLRITNSYC